MTLVDVLLTTAIIRVFIGPVDAVPVQRLFPCLFVCAADLGRIGARQCQVIEVVNRVFLVLFSGGGFHQVELFKRISFKEKVSTYNSAGTQCGGESRGKSKRSALV